jgi:hypothetical protein
MAFLRYVHSNVVDIFFCLDRIYLVPVRYLLPSFGIFFDNLPQVSKTSFQ